MKNYRLRIPGMSLRWIFQKAESEEKAFDIVVSKLESDNSHTLWRDREIWEIEEIDDQGKKKEIS